MTDAMRKQRALGLANLQSARILLADPALPPESLEAQWARMVLRLDQKRDSAEIPRPAD